MTMTNPVRLHCFIVILLLLSSIVSCNDQQKSIVEYRVENEISIIPKVDSLKILDGYFEISDQTVILVHNDPNNAALLLKALIDRASSFEIPIINIKNSQSTQFKNSIFVGQALKSFNMESYGLKVLKNEIVISGKSEEANINAVHTLRQLFINEFHFKEKRDQWFLPCVIISDEPRFKHRGLLLDCSRHFFGKEVIKKYIDLLSLYKMNVLHWHLTEDQGWRIAIDAFPKLTEIGAWRTELNGSRYGGFYTKADIREIVAHAKTRGVTVIPEIELPGHSQAAIASYPHLSCTGKQVEVANDWGVFKEIYCAGNDSVFQFLEAVLDEVLDLFPSKYIHIGGDEAPKFRWEHCDKCQKRMKDHNLKDEYELQRYFISRIETYLNANGRQLIGWGEILEGGLSPNATVQSWRGMEGGIAAAQDNHQAIMSPTSHAYFDYDLKSIDLEKVYNFDPIPKELPEESMRYIIGGECNMWTEHVPNDSVLDSKVFPRLLAMSEVLWSYPGERDYESFYKRVQKHYPLLSALNVRYGAETIPISLTTRIDDESVYVEAKPGHESLEIKYKWDGDSSTYQSYNSPLPLTRSGIMIFQAYKKDESYGMAVNQKLEYHKALGEVVVYKYLFNKWYESNKMLALVDGRLGSTDFKDGCWQGFWGDDIVVDIMLDTIQTINHLETHFYQYNNSWIFIPEYILFEGSLDGETFYELGTMKAKTDPKARGSILKTLY